MPNFSKPVDIKFDFYDFGYDAIMENMAELKGSYVEIGLWGEGGGPEDNIAARGAVQEYGTISGRIPSRPFMRRTFDHNQQQIFDYTEKLLEQLAGNFINGVTFLGNLGAFYEGLIKETFTEGGFEVNAASTIKGKGSDVPLIDTGLMRDSITSKVSIKNHELFKSFIEASEENKISEEAESE